MSAHDDGSVTVTRTLTATVNPEQAMFLEEAELPVLPFLPGGRQAFGEELVKHRLQLDAVHGDLQDRLEALGQDHASDAGRALKVELIRVGAMENLLDYVMQTIGAGMLAPSLTDNRRTIQ